MCSQGLHDRWAYNCGVITTISSVSVMVSDQDRSLAFYRDKLGFELQMDAPMGQSRWIQLAPSGAQTSLILSKPTPDMPPEVYERSKAMVGGFANFIFGVDDIQATYQELSARGVEFEDKPAQQPWGWWASIKDPDGNVIGVHQ
jgi:predicted enzyme related to lactoylglutathione lyase